MFTSGPSDTPHPVLTSIYLFNFTSQHSKIARTLPRRRWYAFRTICVDSVRRRPPGDSVTDTFGTDTSLLLASIEISVEKRGHEHASRFLDFRRLILRLLILRLLILRLLRLLILRLLAFRRCIALVFLILRTFLT